MHNICIHFKTFANPLSFIIHELLINKMEWDVAFWKNLKENEDQLGVILLGIMWSGHRYPPSAFHFN